MRKIILGLLFMFVVTFPLGPMIKSGQTQNINDIQFCCLDITDISVDKQIPTSILHSIEKNDENQSNNLQGNKLDTLLFKICTLLIIIVLIALIVILLLGIKKSILQSKRTRNKGKCHYKDYINELHENNEMSNKVFLCGEIMSTPVFSHEWHHESFYEFTISVPRLSHQCDIIPITVSKRLMDSKVLKVGKMVAIVGQFRSYNKIIDCQSKLILTVFLKELLDNTQINDDYINNNYIELSGYICKEPKYRTTPLERKICNIMVAVNRTCDRSDYIPCITWGRAALFSSTLPKGTKVNIIGRIQSRQYLKKDKTVSHTVYEVSVSKLVPINQTKQ